MFTKTTAIEFLELRFDVELSTFKKAAQEIVIELAEKIKLKESSFPNMDIDNIEEMGKPDLVMQLKVMVDLESPKLKTLEKTRREQLIGLITAILKS
jgi:hypothetical protein